MSKIRIKNFGPIKEGLEENEGWIDIKKVTVFIGNQGSGKSTVAKLISLFSWIEKALTRGDYDIKWFTENSKFKSTYCAYHRLENYFFDKDGRDNVEIAYEGESFSMKYISGSFSIQEVKDQTKPYPLPQIMYVPAERNFISTVKSPQLLKLSSDSLIEFLTEFDNAKSNLNGTLKLPINNTDLEYDQLTDIINIKGEDYRVRLTEASSGFQSLVPLYLVSMYLTNSVIKQVESDAKEPMSSDELKRFRKGVADIWSIPNLTEEQKRAAISALSSKFNKTAFINIVEEPEQNLFPSSQRQILNSLLGFNDMSKGNKLILTTHSPYIINYLTLAIQGHYLVHEKIRKWNKKVKDADLLKKKLVALDKIVPIPTLVSSTDVTIYELEDKGRVRKLKTYEGIPSDKNYLNQSLAEASELFDSLLEIEQSLS